jgi:hypothetical protein
MFETCAPVEGDKSVNERRSEARVPAAGAGKLTVISPRSLENLAADVLDVSRWGLQLEVGAFIESGSLVELQLRTITVSGEVAHSRPIGSGRHRVGISTGHVTELRSKAVNVSD